MSLFEFDFTDKQPPFNPFKAAVLEGGVGLELADPSGLDHEEDTLLFRQLGTDEVDNSVEMTDER